MNSPKINIIYIASSAHSGSTLLDLMLGSHSEIHSGGEFYKLPLKMRTDGGKLHDCSCGKKVIECDFWARAAEKANTNIEEIQSSRDFFSMYERLIPAILAVSGKTYFVDSSKSLLRLKKYLESEQCQVAIIHLVRDPRAVAYSFVRKSMRMAGKNRRGFSKDNLILYFHTLWRVLRGNLQKNKSLSNQKVYHTIRYEELIAHPKQTLTGFLERLKLPFEETMIEYYDQTHHIVGGNHMRFQKKPLMTDREYTQKLSLFVWITGTFICLPLILKYHYPLFRLN